MKIAAVLLPAVLATMAIAGCSRPTDAVIPSDIGKWDTDLAPQVKKLSEAEQKLAVGYITRMKVGEALKGQPVPFGTTLGDAIEQQKRWLAERDAADRKAAELKAQVEKEQAVHRAAVDQAVTVTLISKTELPQDRDAQRYRAQQRFSIAVKNTGQKELLGVSGELEFIDVFDKTVGAVVFRISQKIPPGGGTLWEGARDYNEFLPAHRAVWQLEEGKYKTRFIPDTLVFSDGSKLQAGGAKPIGQIRAQ